MIYTESPKPVKMVSRIGIVGIVWMAFRLDVCWIHHVSLQIQMVFHSHDVGPRFVGSSIEASVENSMD